MGAAAGDVPAMAMQAVPDGWVNIALSGLNPAVQYNLEASSTMQPGSWTVDTALPRGVETLTLTRELEGRKFFRLAWDD